MNRNIFLTVIVFSLFMQLCRINATDIDTIKSRLIEMSYISTTDATSYLASQQTNGSWSDINYSDTTYSTWEPMIHLKRLKSMSAAYQESSHAYYQNTTMLTAINNGLDYWYSINPVCSNYWYNDMGKQNELIAIGLLMESELTSTRKDNIIDDMPTDTGLYTGQNKVWISGEIIYGGLLKNSDSIIKNGLGLMQETLELTSNEGIQYDYSFAQHGKMLYSAGYGCEFISSVAKWAYIVRATNYAFSHNSIKAIRGYLLDGCQWMIFYNMFDYSASGRYISRQNLNSSILVKSCERMAVVDSSKYSDYNALKNNILGYSAPAVSGNRFFPYNDFMTHVRNGYYFSVKMNSRKTLASETVNDENLKGKWLSCGVNFICTEGDEYDNIMPIWDWAHLPGVTNPVFVDAADHGQFSNFVGGVSDGQHGVAVMDMDYADTTAKKAWFFFDDEIVAIGCGINSSRSERIVTNINQCFSDGNVYLDGNSTNLSPGDWYLDNIESVYHDNIGYVFFSSISIRLKNQSQSGDWYSINHIYSDDIVSNDVFSLWLNHGTSPSNATYQYIVVPDVTPSEIDSYANDIPVTVISNTTSVQAVRQESDFITGIIFHSAGSVTVHSNLTVETDKPCVVLLDESGSTPVVKVSNPDNSELLVNITLNYVSGTDYNFQYNLDSLIGYSRTSVTCKPSEDTYIRSGSHAYVNYGSETNLDVKQNSTTGSYDRRGLLKFDLSGISGVASAKLRLYCYNLWDSSTSTILYECSDSWTEDSVVYATAPTSGDEISRCTIDDEGMYFDWDVTEYVKEKIADGAVSFMVHSDDYDYGTSFYSKEYGSNAPQLVISEPIIREPTVDAQTRGGSYADTNYGDSSSFGVQEGSGDSKYIAYIKFYVSDVTKASNARLRLYCNSLSNGTININVHEISSNWDEETITYNNAPTLGDKLKQYQADATSQYIEWDISRYVQNASIGESVSFALITTDTTGNAWFSSQEGAHPPQLVIEPSAVKPAEDSYTRDGDYDDENFGMEKYLILKDSNLSYTRYGLTKFDISSINKINKATIRMAFNGLWDGACYVSLYDYPNNWSESNVTYNNMPSVGSYITNCYVNDNNTYFEWDVTSSVKNNLANGMVSFAAQPDTIHYGMEAFSKEASYMPPELIINWPIYTPEDDAYVQGGTNADNNYGSASTLFAKDCSDANYDRRTYIKFNIGTLESVSEAKLRLRCSALENGEMTVIVYRTTDSWDEGNITFNNAPSIGSSVDSCTVSYAGGYFEWDVTDYIKDKMSSSSVSFVIYTSVDKYASFESKENDNAPQLIITP